MEYVAQRCPLCNPALLSNDAPNSLKFPRHALVNCNYVIERVRDLTGHACPVIWQSRGKIAAFKCHQRRKQLSDIELVAVESRTVSGRPNRDSSLFFHERLEGSAYVRIREFDASDYMRHNAAPYINCQISVGSL